MSAVERLPVIAPVYYEDCAVGEELPRLVKGPLSIAHVMRWSAATENWHRMHFDQPYARQIEGLPDVLVNGSFKQTVLIQLLVDWAGETGWLMSLEFAFRGMNLPGETLSAWGRVERMLEAGGFGVVVVAVGLVNDAGTETTPGTAVVVLPKRSGPAVPYPFDPVTAAAIEAQLAAA